MAKLNSYEVTLVKCMRKFSDGDFLNKFSEMDLVKIYRRCYVTAYRVPQSKKELVRHLRRFAESLEKNNEIPE